MIIKKYNKNYLIQINPYTGYYNYFCKHKEYIALKILENISKIIIPKNYKYVNFFPIVIDYKINNFIILSNEGIDLQKIKTMNYKIIVYNTIQQINFIIKILNKSGIEHLDLNLNGKNICINKKGKISLIDFDICYIKNYDKKLNIKMRERLSRHRNYNTFNRILQILQSTPNLKLLY